MNECSNVNLGWKSVLFGDVVHFVSNKSNTCFTNLSNYISTENMLPNFGGITIASGVPTSGSVGTFKEGDTLFSNIRTYFKKVWLANFEGHCSNDVLVFRSKNKSLIDPDFLFQVCRWPVFTEYTVRTSKGAKMPRGDKNAMAEFQFQLPLLKEQQAIAHVLGTLDDKIELNRKRIETLEEMARTLFKAWFVDFEPVKAKMQGRWKRGQSLPGLPADLYDLFPEKLVDSEYGEIPEGWETKSLDEIATFLNGLALQKYPAQGGDSGLPVIKIAELRNGVGRGSDIASSEIPEKYLVCDGDFIFSWSGSLMAKFWTGGPGALNQHLFKVTSEAYPMWFVSLWVNYYISYFQMIAASKATTMGHIQRKHLAEAKVVSPPNDKFIAFGVIKNLISDSIKTQIESKALANLRDTLLPKLISGQVRIKDPERLLQEIHS